MIPSKIYFVVGEQSGDQHAADVIEELRKRNSNLQIRGRGGDSMKNAGCEIAFHYNEMAFMGFTKVILNLSKIRQHLQEVENDIRNFNPEVVIFVDYPGFNLRLASQLYNDFQLVYYIAPKVWAWNTKRVHKIKKYIHQVYSILPFEISFFKKHEVNAIYVGNPSLFQVKRYLSNNSLKTSQKYLALLPGSRKQEIERMLPIMLSAADKMGLPYKISKAESIDFDFYLQFTPEEKLEPNMYDLLRNASIAIVTSGTATLETALFEVPQVVCYKTDWFSYSIGRIVIKVPYISLVNLIANQPLVSELIQGRCTEESIIKEIQNIQENRTEYLKNYQIITSKLGEQVPHIEVANQLEKLS